MTEWIPLRAIAAKFITPYYLFGAGFFKWYPSRRNGCSINHMTVPVISCRNSPVEVTYVNCEHCAVTTSRDLLASSSYLIIKLDVGHIDGEILSKLKPTVQKGIAVVDRVLYYFMSTK